MPRIYEGGPPRPNRLDARTRYHRLVHAHQKLRAHYAELRNMYDDELGAHEHALEMARVDQVYVKRLAQALEERSQQYHKDQWVAYGHRSPHTYDWQLCTMYPCKDDRELLHPTMEDEDV